MKTLLDLLLIACVVVFAIDVSPFYRETTSAFVRWLTKGRVDEPLRLKPFSCSLCMTFWIGLLYLAICSHFTLGYIVALCLVSYLTTAIAMAYRLICDLLEKLIDYATRKINR